jgi:WD40 repeat protein
MSRIPDSPYKGLAAFEDSEVDALLFFGRRRECDAVAANVLANRLTVLYGPSGVGKSSLLHAGVARRLRELTAAPVVLHDAWAEDPVAGLIASLRAECGELGATAGLVDTVAAATQRSGEIHLLLDHFEEYILYHGLDGPLSATLPELLRRPGLRVNVLLALRDDALSELDEFSGRIPELFGNLLRLDRLGRDAGRAAILGPLERFGQLTGDRYKAEDALVEAVLDEASTDAGVEAPYLQLVLERLWEHEQAAGSHDLRLATFRAMGGGRAVIREHVQGALERLTLPEQEVAARVVRQLVTPSGRKVSHEPSDLAEYADVEAGQLRQLLDTLARERIVRGVNGTPGTPTRYEIFHDVLGPPILAWQAEHELRSERLLARRQRRRLQTIVAASFVALAVVAAIAAYALVQRSDARTQARHAHGRALAGRALADIPTNPQVSVELALRAAQLTPGRQTADVLRSSLAAMRERAILRLGGNIVAAAFAPRGERLLVASSDGKLGLFAPTGRLLAKLPRQHPLTQAVWSPEAKLFATGALDGRVAVWQVGRDTPVRTISTPSPVSALSFSSKTLLIASGTHLRLLDLASGRKRTIGFRGAVVAAALDPNGRVFAVSYRSGKGTVTSILDAHTGHTLARLHEDGIRSFAFSPDGRLLATGSRDLTARIWNSRTGKLLHVLQHKGYVLDERFSADGKSLVTASQDGAAYLWDVATGQRELLLVGTGGAVGAVNAAAFSPDGSEIATASADRFGLIYYSRDGRLIAPLAGHGDAVTSIGFDPSGRAIVTGSSDGTARLWDALPEGTLEPILQAGQAVNTFFADQDPVSVAGRKAEILSTSGRVLRTLSVPGPITTWATDGQHLAIADARGDLALASRTGPPSTGHFPGLSALAYTDETLLIGFTNGNILVAKSSFYVHAPGRVLSLDAAGGRFLVRLARQVRVYTGTGTLVSTIRTKALQATLSPDGGTVATTRGKKAELWDASTGRLLHTLGPHGSLVSDAQFSPNGRQLVTVSYDHEGRIWSVRTGRLLRTLVGHSFPIRTGSYSPDGHWIVTASYFTAGLWNAGTGQLVAYLTGDAGLLTGASFSPAGNWILTGSEGGTAGVYHCQICQPLPRLESLAAARLRALGS